MDLIVIAAVALVASTATFFAGFGLGTVLLPVMAIFMPTEPAVAATAIVHFINSALKLGLTRRYVDMPVFIRFGIPAFGAAFVGAVVLRALAGVDPIARYRFAGTSRELTILNLVIGLLLLALAVQELTPRLQRASVPARYLPLGGIASGFLGGLAGLQGALRSAFLIRARLDAPVFVGTGAAIALLVDAARLGTYAAQGSLSVPGLRGSAFAVAVVGASVGTLLGNRLLERVTFQVLRIVVGCALVILGIGLAAGFL